MRNVAAFLVFIVAFVGAARAQQPFDAPGLRFCAPPIKPSCVDDAETYRSRDLRADCQKAMDRYVPTVFAYRQCLNNEMERAVRQTNQTIQRFRCRVKGERRCP